MNYLLFWKKNIDKIKKLENMDLEKENIILKNELNINYTKPFTEIHLNNHLYDIVTKRCNLYGVKDKQELIIKYIFDNNISEFIIHQHDTNSIIDNIIINLSYNNL